ncbi:MAG: amidase family protein, partial [Lysobacterales bacterium]
MKNKLWHLDATEMAAGIRNRSFSSREVVTSCLQRLDSVNPQLNAVVESRPDEALAAADKADKAVADGKDLGLLHGVPVTIKGVHDLAGWATVNGCAALKDNIALVSSPCIQNWLDAGAVVLGRTNTPEFSCRWETTNDFYGATSNPWNSERTPGGSSGGAAVSVAVGINPLSTGTDLGGSLRQPAQACGVASMRPGSGRVPDWNGTDPAEA